MPDTAEGGAVPFPAYRRVPGGGGKRVRKAAGISSSARGISPPQCPPVEAARRPTRPPLDPHRAARRNFPLPKAVPGDSTSCNPPPPTPPLCDDPLCTDAP